MSHKFLPHRHRGRFYFNKDNKPESFLLHSLPSLIGAMWGRKRRISTRSLEWVSSDIPLERSVDLHVTWIGHATFLIQVGGINILTDPIFGNASPFFPRLLPPGITLDALPPIDVVLLSHNHPDHMDRSAMRWLIKHNEELKVLVPHGDGRLCRRWGAQDVTEFEWWQSMVVAEQAGSPMVCTFVPASHWSRRGLFDTNRSLWGGWVITWRDKSIYFAGDTAYAHHFESIAKEFPALDVALLPIGPCEPDKHMRKTHSSAAEAGRALCELGARHLFPMHWGTFLFGHDHFDLPITLMRKWWDNAGSEVADKTLHVVKVGQRVRV